MRLDDLDCCAVTPRTATIRRFSSCRTGSRLNMSGKWRPDAAPLEREKQSGNSQRICTLATGNKFARFIWNICWHALYRPSPAPLHCPCPSSPPPSVQPGRGTTSRLIPTGRCINFDSLHPAKVCQFSISVDTLARWRKIWTSSCVTDTALFIKPCGPIDE